MKKRKSECYLIVSSCYIGLSEPILKTYAQVVKKYNAKVIHLGPTASGKEITAFHKMLKTRKKIESDLSIKTLKPSEETQKEERLTEVCSLVDDIELAERSRLDTLVKYFGKDMIFVTNDFLSLPGWNYNKYKRLNDGMELSEFLFLSPIPPSGERSARAPINSVSATYLKQKGKNWVVAHPVPSIQPLPRPGLNQVHDYFSVGCLLDQQIPNKTNELYKMAHMPCALMVVLDKNNGEFHAKQMHIDYTKGDLVTRRNPLVIDDGMVFSGTGAVEVGNADRATLSTDDHVPYQHPGVLGSLRCLNGLFTPETFINGGDAADFDPINPHAKGHGEMEGLRLHNTLDSLAKLLKAQTDCPSIKHKILIDSNHHDWLTDFVNKNPCLKGMLDWKTIAEKYFKEWNVYLREAGENKIHYFGDFAIRHGDRENGVQDGERKFDFGKYLCGHWHKFMAYRRAVQIGCGAMLGPKYTKNQINAWQNMIASLTKFKEVTAVNPKIILHDKEKKMSRFAYRDSIYEAEHYFL